MNGRIYPFVGEQENIPFAPMVTNIPIVSERIQVLAGGYIKNGAVCVVNIKYKALRTAAASPSILNSLPRPVTEAALSCIDITSGIGEEITSGVPCGVNVGGTVYTKEITADHIYSMTGAYVMA